MKLTNISLCFILCSFPCSTICMEKKFEMKPEQPSVSEQLNLTQEKTSTQPSTLKDAQSNDPDCCTLCLGASTVPLCLGIFVTVYGCCLPCLKNQTPSTQAPSTNN